MSRVTVLAPDKPVRSGMTDVEARKRIRSMIDQQPGYYQALRELSEMADDLRDESAERARVYRLQEQRKEQIKRCARALLTACSKTPHGSHRLAEIAGIPYSEDVRSILKKLHDAGKVRFVDGKWVRK